MLEEINEVVVETRKDTPVRGDWCAVDLCRCDGKCRKRNTIQNVGIVCKEKITWEQANLRLVPKKEYFRRRDE